MSNASLVPTAVEGRLESAVSQLQPILLAVETDVRIDGSPATLWLVVTPEHLSVVERADGEAAFTSIDKATPESGLDYRLGIQESSTKIAIEWDRIEQFRTVSGTGSGMLQAKLAKGWIDILRFSNRLAGRFHKVSRRLETMLEAYRDSGDVRFDEPNLLPRNESPSVALNGSPHRSPAGPLSIASEDELDWEEGLNPPRCPNCQLRLANSHESCPRCLQKGRILRRVGELLRPHMRGAIFLSVLTIVGVAAELIPPKLQQYMVDHILGANATPTGSTSFTTALLIVVLALAASRVVLSAVGWMKGRISTVIGTGLTSALREDMVRKLQNVAVVYYDRHQVGSTLSRVAHDSEVLHGMMHQITGGFLLQTVQLFGVGAMLVWINPKLALFTLIPVPLVFLGSWIFWQRVYPRYYRLWDASSKQMSVLNGMLTGIRVVKAFAQEDRETKRFQSASEHLRKWRLWVDQTNASYSAAMQLVFSLGGLIVWYVGGRDVIGQDMTLGQLIAFLAYLAMFYAPLSALSNFTTWLTSFLSGSKRVLELLDMPMTITEPASPEPWEKPQGAIRFNKVSFGYDRNQPVLKDISFDVQPGEMVGIVGRSGSGKTTMVNLLGRFYDVQEGAIEVDGIDLRNLSMRQLRQRIGIVFQESFLFRGTIWKNLSYGRPDTTIEEGLEAARAAGAHDFICRTQLAYETLLGEHGAGLSGGEKQRLSIARTLLYAPKILILDEATSNIDAESERSIQEALEVLIQGRTTVAIAHRLSTLRNADRILVFDRGRLVEQGSHAALIEADGVYARLVKIQSQVSKDPNVDRLLLSSETAKGTSEPPIDDKPRADTVSEKAESRRKKTNEANRALSVTENTGSAVESMGLSTTTLDPALDAAGQSTPKQRLIWLQPDDNDFRLGEYGQIELWSDNERLSSGLFVVRTFPASYPDEFLSVRGWNEHGDEVEFGMIRDLTVWPQEAVQLISDAIARRYLLREIRRIHEIDLKAGYLDFDVETDYGREKFSVRWTQSQASDFGEHGKLLIDTEDNRYLVSDLNLLAKPEAEKFMQYVYW